MAWPVFPIKEEALRNGHNYLKGPSRGDRRLGMG